MSETITQDEFTVSLSEEIVQDVEKIAKKYNVPVEGIKKTLYEVYSNPQYESMAEADRIKAALNVVAAKLGTMKKPEEQKVPEEPEVKEISLSELKALKDEQNTRRMTDLSQVLPEDHFINHVTTWISSMSDTYYEYQVCAALWLLSAVTQGNVVLKTKQETVYPNLYVLILGQSTKSRKSTSISKAKQIFEAATDTTLYNDDFSIEGYLETLAENHIGNYVRDEAAGLIAKYNKKYNDGIYDLEAAIYDCQSVKKTLASAGSKSTREFTVEKPYVTHFYATTPDKYTAVMELVNYLNGYGFRFLHAYPTYKKGRMDIELESKENIESWAKVLTSTKTLYSFFSYLDKPIEFTATPEAMKLYNDISVELEDKAEEMNNDTINSAIGRAQGHILKIAMLIEIGKSEPSYTITKESILIASSLIIDFFLPSCIKTIDLLQEDIKFNKIEKAIATIRKMGGSCSKSALIKNAHFTQKERDECMGALLEAGVIEERKIKETGAIEYILMDESKQIEFNSGGLSEQFRTFHTFRKVHSFTRTEINSAKSAKSNNISEVINKNQEEEPSCHVRGWGVSCETVKSAKSAKSANFEPTSISTGNLFDSFDTSEIEFSQETEREIEAILKNI